MEHQEELDECFTFEDEYMHADGFYTVAGLDELSLGYDPPDHDRSLPCPLNGVPIQVVKTLHPRNNTHPQPVLHDSLVERTEHQVLAIDPSLLSHQYHTERSLDHPYVLPWCEDASTINSPSTPLLTPSGQGRKVKRLTDVQKRLLQSWLDSHRHNPYPDKYEKEQLARKANLKVTQVVNWFARTLHRKGLLRECRDIRSDATTHQLVGYDNTNKSSFTALAQTLLRPQIGASFRPPSRHVPLSGRVVDHEISISSPTAEYSDTYNNVEDDGHFKDHISWTDIPTPGSVVPLLNGWDVATPESQDQMMELISQSIESPSALLTTPRRGLSRYGRRRNGSSVVSDTGSMGSNKSVSEKARLSCSSCSLSFSRKSSLTRHYTSVHEASAVWICEPLGTSCPLCGRTDSGCGHNFAACCARPEAQRTFPTMDSLRQHLKLVHGLASPKPNLNRWKKDFALFPPSPPPSPPSLSPQSPVSPASVQNDGANKAEPGEKGDSTG